MSIITRVKQKIAFHEFEKDMYTEWKKSSEALTEQLKVNIKLLDELCELHKKIIDIEQNNDGLKAEVCRLEFELKMARKELDIQTHLNENFIDKEKRESNG